MRKNIFKGLSTFGTILFLSLYNFGLPVLALDDISGSIVEEPVVSQEETQTPEEPIIEEVVTEPVISEPVVLPEEPVVEETPVVEELIVPEVIEQPLTPVIEEPTTTIVTETSIEGSLNAKLITDKADYSPNETAIISGTGYKIMTEYVLVIYSNDVPATYFETIVKSDLAGSFTYHYTLDGVYRPNYFVEVHTIEKEIISLHAFTDSLKSGCIIDSDGPNDEPGQKDLNKMCVDYSGLPTLIQVTWNWDEIDWTGANTGDTCGLFDTDNDGLANYALCVSVEGNPAQYQSDTLFSCTDGSAQRCTGPTQITGSSSCTANVESSDPFPGPANKDKGDEYPEDTVARCNVVMADFGITGQLIDTCSYPSSNPNSDPSDCVMFRTKSGKLEIVKNLVPSNDSGLFDLQIDGTTYANNVSHDGSTGDIVLDEGTYTVGEVAGSGTTLSNYTSSIVCKTLNGTGTTVASSSNSGPLSVVINDNDDILCTITNTRKTGHLIVQKTTLPSGQTTTFDITASSSNGGTVLNGASGTISDTNDHDYQVTLGTYSVSETVPLGWTQTGNTCTNIVVGESETKYCEITNALYSSLTIVKIASPNSSQDFEFTTSGAGLSTFYLDDDDDSSLSNTKVFNTLLPGTYSVSEGVVSGWDLTETSCSDGSSVASIEISAGEKVTCTFTNVQRGTISGYKYNDADGSYLTDNDRTAVANWTIEINGEGITKTTTTASDGSYSFTNLKPGNYVLTEYLKLGWFKLFPSDIQLNVALEPGENDVNNNFINVEYASITVFKNVDSDGDGTIDEYKSGSWEWDINGSGDYSTGVTVDSLAPGQYTVSEDGQAGYHVTDLTCNTGSLGAIDSYSFNLNSGDDLVCTFTNTRDTGTLKVVKSVVNDNGGTAKPEDFMFDIDSGQDISFESDGENEYILPTGLYIVNEVYTGSEYSVTYDNCNKVEVTRDTTSTCTVTNDDIAPSLTLTKEVKNDNGGLALAGDWTLSATGPTTISGTSTVSSGSDFKAGTYTLSESGGPSGYEAGAWDCQGSNSDNSITIELGKKYSCVIVNDDIAPTITLNKVVINDNGGVAGINDFGIMVEGNIVDSGTKVPVLANTPAEINETGLPGYTFVSITGDEKCPTSLGGIVTLVPGENITCTITNDDQSGKIIVTKDVVNKYGNGEDVYAQTSFDISLYDGKNTLPGTIRDSEVDPIIATFDNLNAGEYAISELPVNGFISGGCSPDLMEDTKDLTTLLVGRLITLNNGEELHVTCTNMIIDPMLEIEKSNNSGGADKLAGDSVEYTITVTAPKTEDDFLTLPNQVRTPSLTLFDPKYIVEDVIVTDLPPAGFEYVSGSWSAVSSINGPLSIPQPIYNSPASWYLGDMIEGEIITLKYLADISNSQDAGNYKDLALARGTSLIDEAVLANLDSGYFVGTDVRVVSGLPVADVLGISEYIKLPDTGANTLITLGGIIALALGIFTFAISSSKKKYLILILGLFAILGLSTLMTPNQSYAGAMSNIAVQIEQPATPNNHNDFKIGFVALDLLGREINIKCKETTYGEYQSFTLSAGGNSGNCQTNSTVIPTSGTYEFYVEATAGAENVTSQKVSVKVDMVGPSKVVDYSKTVNICSNTIKFTTANDLGETVKVQIFRSTNPSFTADSSTLIKEITVGSNTPVSYTDPLPVCDADYYYAVRALDDANNTSEFVADKNVIVTIIPGTVITPVVTPDEGGEVISDEDTDTDDEDNNNGEDNDNDGEVLGEKDKSFFDSVKENWKWYALGAGGLILAILGAYTYVRNKKKNS